MTPEAKRRKNQKKKQKQKQKKAAAAAASGDEIAHANESSNTNNNDNISILQHGEEASPTSDKGENVQTEQSSVEPSEIKDIPSEESQSFESIAIESKQQQTQPVVTEEPQQDQQAKLEQKVKPVESERLPESIEQEVIDEKVLSDVADIDTEEVIFNNDDLLVNDTELNNPIVSVLSNQTGEFTEEPVIEHISSAEDQFPMEQSTEPVSGEEEQTTQDTLNIVSQQDEVNQPVENPVEVPEIAQQETVKTSPVVVNDKVKGSIEDTAPEPAQFGEHLKPETSMQEDDLFGSNNDTEAMPWEQKQEQEPTENESLEAVNKVAADKPLENEDSSPKSPQHAGDLFENTDTDETLPWHENKSEGVQKEIVEDELNIPESIVVEPTQETHQDTVTTNESPQQAEDKLQVPQIGEVLETQNSMHEDDLFGGSPHDNLMPWEQEQVENISKEDTVQEVVKDETVQDQPNGHISLENSNVVPESIQHADDLFEHNDNDEPLPWEENDNVQRETTNVFPSDDIKQTGLLNETSEGTPALFDEDMTADDTFLHHSDYNDHLSQDDAVLESVKPTVVGEAKEVPANEASKKFSFLQDDDDLLEDDDDSFLESEDEDEVVTQEHARAESIVSSEGITLDQIPRSHSNTQASNASKYAPAALASNQTSILPQDGTVGIVLPQQINSISKSTTSIASNNGAAIPSQPQFQVNHPPVNGNAQQVIEKLTVEKKKSDAYDFPMDLIVDKVKPVHAKAVGVPTPKLANTPLIPRKGSRQSSVSISKPSGYQSLDAVSNMSLPVNPYAAVIKEESMIKKVPPPAVPVGIVPPSVNLPSSPHLANNNMSTMSSASMLPPPARGRTFSNISATSAQSNQRANMYAPQANLNMAPPKKVVQPSQYAPQLPVAPQVPQMAPSQFNFPPTNNNTNMPVPIAPVNTNLGGVAPDVTSPTNYTPATRGNHARKKSSLYTPNSNESSSRYAPTVHPQYQQQGATIQNGIPGVPTSIPTLYQPNIPVQGISQQTQPNLPGNQYHPANVPINSVLPPQNVMHQQTQNLHYQAGNPQQFQPPKTSMYGNTHSAHSSYGVTPVMDNVTLQSRQFPLFQWSSSNRIVYGIPVMGAGYGGNVSSTITSLNIINYEAIVKPNPLFKSFPGPLTHKSKKKDVEKWLVSINSGLNLDANSVEALVWKMLQIKLSDNYSFRDVSEALYDTQELKMYLSQPFNPNLPQPNAYRLDTIGQMRVLASLQIGDHDTALRDTLAHKDFTMAALIGSLVPKDRWTGIVEAYLSEGIHNNNDNNTCTNLLSVIFQAFIGNAKATVQKFYSNPNEGVWAMNNWRIIVAALLTNITTDANVKKIPPVIMEFLLEFAIFLYHKDLKLAAAVLFMIVDCPLTNIPVLNDSDVTFEHIGNASSEQSVLWSELYEYHSILLNPKLSNYDILLPQKVYHGMCLQEQGLTNLATKYSDYIASKMKQLNKKDLISLNMSSRIEELQSRLVDSSSGWLAKPKLSSVWGQLDKSFNKYIGGDEEVPQQPSHKKVFDNYTPTTSNNSSLADLTQHQGFTPYHVNAERSNQDSGVLFAGEPRYHREGVLPTTDPLFRATSYSALNEHVPHFPGPPSMKRTMSRSSGIELKKTMSALETTEALNSLHSQPPHFAHHSMKGSPRKTNLYNVGHNSQLTALNQETVNSVPPITRIPLPIKRDSFAKPAEVAKSSIKHEIVQSLVSENTQANVSQTPPVQYAPSIHPTQPVQPVQPIQPVQPATPVQHHEPAPSAPQHEFVQSSHPVQHHEPVPHIPQDELVEPPQPVQPIQPEVVTTESQLVNEVVEEAQAENTQSEEDIQNTENTKEEKVKPISVDETAQTTDELASQHIVEETIGNEEVCSQPADKETLLEKSSETVTDVAPPSVASRYTPQTTVENEVVAPNGTESGIGPETSKLAQTAIESTTDLPNVEEVDPNKVNETSELIKEDISMQPEIEENIGLGITEADGNMLPPPPVGIKKVVSPGSPVNPYAPVKSSVKKAAKKTFYTPTVQTYSTPNVFVESNNTPVEGNMYSFAGNNSVPADLSRRAEYQYSPMEANEEVASTITSEIDQESSYDSVPPLNVMKRDKRTSQSGEFEPIIKPSSSVLTGIPSIKEGGIQYNDEVEEESDEDEDEEKDRKRKEKKKENKKDKKKTNEEGKPGWFGWLKKDPNEKKAVKAKLGHQNNFYYDEKLKRWVNKDATEEDKQKLQEASAPPPPPVVKRKENAVKTAPRQSFSHPKPESPAIGSLPATVLPVNPFSGKPIPQTPSSVSVSPTNDTPVAETPRSPPLVNNSIPVNLTGKKSNGLDDILNISSATVNRRKKKAGRGYVNVMENR